MYVESKEKIVSCEHIAELNILGMFCFFGAYITRFYITTTKQICQSIKRSKVVYSKCTEMKIFYQVNF